MFKKAFVAFLLFLLMATPAIATIAFDATANGQDSNVASLTWSHTCTGSDLVLIVGVSTRGGDGDAVPTGVTYNGVAMTLIDG